MGSIGAMFAASRPLRVLLLVPIVGALVVAPSHSSGATNAIVTVAGTGIPGFGGDGGAATAAQLNGPSAVAIDPAGNLYIADSYNHRIRRIAVNGIITTVAGNGTEGDEGDGGPATAATLTIPFGVSVDASGAVLVSDAVSHRVRRIGPEGTITTVAGTGTAGFTGDNGPAVAARLDGPAAAVGDTNGNIYIADTGNHRIRRISINGTITTVAGNGIAGFAGDNGPAGAAQLNNPSDVAIDATGNIYVADTANHRIRKIATDGTITTVAGNGIAGFTGDNGPATGAQLNTPADVAVDANGNLAIADTANHRVRRVTTNGTIVTVAGNGNAGFGGDAGAPTSAKLASPTGLAIDAAGNIVIVDSDNHRLRRMGPPAAPLTVPRKGGLTPARVASHARLAVPKGARVTLTVASSSRKNCRVRTGRLVSLRSASCRVTVTVTPARGKAKKAVVTLRTL